VADLGNLAPNRPLALAAQSEHGTRFTGKVVVLSLGELDLSSDRLHLSGADQLSTLAG
jgi:hypothetical protein